MLQFLYVIMVNHLEILITYHLYNKEREFERYKPNIIKDMPHEHTAHSYQ